MGKFRPISMLSEISHHLALLPNPIATDTSFIMVTTKAKDTTNSIGRALGRGTKSSSTLNNSVLKGKLVGIQKQDGGVKRNSIESSRSVSPTYNKEQLDEADGREELNPNDPKYNALWKETQAKMGMPKHEPIHSKGMNRIEHILRVFDLDPSYGPCLGMTRLERWERAEKLGDEPPSEIREILETREGVLDLKYSVLHDKGV